MVLMNVGNIESSTTYLEVHFFSLTALELVSLAQEVALVALIELDELLSLVASSLVVINPYVVRLSAISCLLLFVCSLT